MLWLFPLFNKCYKCTQHRVFMVSNGLKKSTQNVCLIWLLCLCMIFFDSHLRYVNYKCLHFQSKNTDHFSETSCQILPLNSRGKRPKWVKWRHQFQVLRVNHFHQVSWFWKFTCHVKFERKLKFWPHCLLLEACVMFLL